ncbi:SDR family NAD(P)-dependent oxidoreductase [Paracoccus haeundaensis]|uniref:SDR family oxidoreductase n=1 Tax=Paracoccus haeundaensis TaxID=225362 RepID=A0A5C4R243_9RHOB|nr:SDR family oxidoreductase [Paracoccus haeundaensis]TNH37996.1 SDR family oxidoreductase [Paracoccus haeundaensis]
MTRPLPLPGADFTGKRVIVTGAAGIFGRWIAEAFDAAGATLLLSDRDQAAMVDVANELSRPALIHATELTDAASIDDLVAMVEREWGAADILVNNAAVYPSGFLLDVDADEWDRIFDINLRAPFLLTRGIATQMVRQEVRGNIVMISSGASRKMRTTAAPYSISKSALDRLTKGFAVELAEYGIRCNAVEPGFAAGSTASPLTDAHVNAVTGAIPLGRASRYEDAPAAVMFLASDAASYITGATLSVDGGGSAGQILVHQDKKKAL